MTTLSIFLIQTLLHTPRWVWVLLLALLALGALQMRSRTVTLWRAVLLPVAMTGFSLYGVLGSTSVQPAAGLVWAAGIAAALGLHGWLGVPRGARWRPATRDFSVPGSWVPLALMLAIFATKFHAGVSVALDPALRGDAVFGCAHAALYGLFSGSFLARGLVLARLARRGAQGRPADMRGAVPAAAVR